MKTAFEELYELLRSEDECHPGILCLTEIEKAHLSMLDALEDVWDAGVFECCCGAPGGACDGTCTYTLVKLAIKKARGK